MINLGVKGQRVDLLRDTSEWKSKMDNMGFLPIFLRPLKKNYKKCEIYIYMYETYFI